MMHEGHKGRLRAKALNSFESLEEHEIIEFLLNFSNIRKNTNPTAHDLLNTFKSFANICDSNVELLKEIEGVGDVSAVLLTTIPKIAEYYYKSKNLNISKINTHNDIVKYFERFFISKTVEEFYVLCLDKKQNIITNLKITSGTDTQIQIPIEKVIAKILKYEPSKIVLSHNHPFTSATPSNEDVEYTKILQKRIELFRIELIDHIIIGKDSSFSLKLANMI